MHRNTPIQATHATLKEALFLPNVRGGGSIGPSLPSSHLTLQNFKMIYQPESGDLHLTWVEGKYQRVFVVSQGNIKGINLVPTEVTESKDSDA